MFASRSRLYYAHPMSDYGTEHERRVEAALARRFTVVNPNRPEHQAEARVRRMAYFLELVEGCEALAFQRFPDGTLGAGAALEAAHALKHGKPVFEIREDGYVLLPVMELTDVLTVEQTRVALRRFRAPDQGHDSAATATKFPSSPTPDIPIP